MADPSLLAAGDPFPIDVLRGLATLSGDPVDLPAEGRLLHVEMRRFAGCPICDLHLRRVSARRAEIAAAGIDEVAVFHSTVRELRRYESAVPIPVVADPEKLLSAALGMTSSVHAYAHLGLVPVLPALAGQVVRGARAGHGLRVAPTGGELGRPADVLVDHEGRIAGIRYGAHAADQWSVDEILARAPGSV